MEFNFTSKRLGFRPWKTSDLNALNSDAQVMKYFPAILNETDNISFINRMYEMFKEKRFCYWVVE